MDEAPATPEVPPPPPDPVTLAIEKAAGQMERGDFVQARRALDLGDLSPDDRARVKTFRNRLRPDPVALATGALCLLALLVVAGQTLFH
jgi:hypothetical protein